MGSSNSKPTARWATPRPSQGPPNLSNSEPQAEIPGTVSEEEAASGLLAPPFYPPSPSKVAAWKIYYDIIGVRGARSEKNAHCYYIPSPYNFVVHFSEKQHITSSASWDGMDNRREPVVFTREEVEYWWDLYKKQEELKAAVRGLRDPAEILPRLSLSRRASSSSDE